MRRSRTPFPSFEPTYQGLKPARVEFNNNNVYRFEPTYQGLKLQLGILGPQRQAGFEPTYQGLKRWRGDYCLRPEDVLSLPIRD